jgi:proliferating cell nuclear antigen
MSSASTKSGNGESHPEGPDGPEPTPGETGGGAEAEETGSKPAWDSDTLREACDVQTAPAENVCEALGGWQELLNAIQSDDDVLEAISGVGPATAESLRESEEFVQSQVDAEAVGGDAESVEESDGKHDEEQQEGSSGGSGASRGLEEFGYGRCSSELTKLEGAIEAQHLKEFISTIDVIVDELVLHVTEEGIYANGVSPDEVMMGESIISKRAWKRYEVDGGRLGLQLDKVTEILSLADRDSLIQFSYDEPTKKLTVTVDGVDYTLAVTDPDSIRTLSGLPDIPLTITFECAGSVFKKIVEAAEIVMEGSAEFSASDDTVQFTAADDVDDFSTDLEEDHRLTALTIDTDEEASVILGEDFIVPVAKKAISKQNEVTARFGDELPLVVKQGRNEGKVQHRTLIAPRVA